MAAHRVSTHRVRPGLVFSPFTPARHAHVVEWVDEVAVLVLDTAIHATVCNVWSVCRGLHVVSSLVSVSNVSLTPMWPLTATSQV
jgi:hypothetical protein